VRGHGRLAGGLALAITLVIGPAPRRFSLSVDRTRTRPPPPYMLFSLDRALVPAFVSPWATFGMLVVLIIARGSLSAFTPAGAGCRASRRHAESSVI
jgi:hypothetical protein